MLCTSVLCCIQGCVWMYVKDKRLRERQRQRERGEHMQMTDWIILPCTPRCVLHLRVWLSLLFLFFLYWKTKGALIARWTVCPFFVERKRSSDCLMDRVSFLCRTKKELWLLGWPCVLSLLKDKRSSDCYTYHVSFLCWKTKGALIARLTVCPFFVERQKELWLLYLPCVLSLLKDKRSYDGLTDRVSILNWKTKGALIAWWTVCPFLIERQKELWLLDGPCVLSLLRKWSSDCLMDRVSFLCWEKKQLWLLGWPCGNQLTHPEQQSEQTGWGFEENAPHHQLDEIGTWFREKGRTKLSEGRTLNHTCLHTAPVVSVTWWSLNFSLHCLPPWCPGVKVFASNVEILNVSWFCLSKSVDIHRNIPT